MLLSAVVLEPNAALRTAVLLSPVVFPPRALKPRLELKFPVVLASKASVPTAVFCLRLSRHAPLL